MKNVKFLAIGALVVGLTVGTAAGYANLQSTEVAEADTARAGVGIADVDKTTSAEEIGRSTDAARAFAQAAFGEDTSPEFRGLTINPYVTDGTVDGKTRYTRAALSFVDSEGMAYRVDKDSGKVIQVGPAPRRSLEEPAPEYDFTERYTQDDLEEMATLRFQKALRETEWINLVQLSSIILHQRRAGQSVTPQSVQALCTENESMRTIAQALDNARPKAVKPETIETPEKETADEETPPAASKIQIDRSFR